MSLILKRNLLMPILNNNSKCQLTYRIVLYCIVLYCIMRLYTEGSIGPIPYKHSSRVVRNPHSALAE